MKRFSLTIIIALCVMAMSAQEAIKVSYKGASPTISDFVSALVASRAADDDEECADEAFNAIAYAWEQHHKGLPLEDGQTLTIDEKNGYVLYEYRSEYESIEHLVKIELCYWNEADGKHKLLAYNVACFTNGKYSVGQFDGLYFYRYNNATKKLTWCDDLKGIEAAYDYDVCHSFALPRKGKDITVTFWYENGKKTEKTLKWDGHRFGF